MNWKARAKHNQKGKNKMKKIVVALSVLWSIMFLETASAEMCFETEGGELCIEEVTEGSISSDKVSLQPGQCVVHDVLTMCSI